MYVHELTNIDVKNEIATCSACGPEIKISRRPLGGGQWGWVCRWVRRLKHSDGSYILVPHREVFRLFVAQRGSCASCGDDISRRFAVDHCHKTGKIRGLLCNSCNSAAGFLYDDPQRVRKLAEYLENTS